MDTRSTAGVTTKNPTEARTENTTTASAKKPAAGTRAPTAIPVTTTTPDPTASARHARFGSLPQRIPYQDMVEERPSAPKNRPGDDYDPETAWMSYSCLAADLGL